MNVTLRPTQFEFVESDKKFTYFTGGYKSGKTHTLVRKALKCLIETNQDGLMAEPTYRMNEDLLRPTLEEAMEQMQINYDWRSSDSLYVTPYGKILLRTQDKRSSLEGHNIGWFGLDEMDLIAKHKNNDNWKTLISKLTKGTKQYGFGAGTNEGFEFVYDKFYKGAEFNGKSYIKGDYELFIGSTRENIKNLPEGYLDTLLSNYDDLLIQRYIDGAFVNIKTGRVYYKFTDYNIVKRELDPSRPIIMTWDVNYSDRPMSTTLIQAFHPSEVFEQVPEYVNPSKLIYVAVKGWYNSNTNTDAQCMIIYEYLQKINYTGTITIYGDRVGNDRRVGASRTHYEIVQEWFKQWHTGKPKIRATRSIIDRTQSLNYLCENAKGERLFFVNKELEPLIIDFQQVSWKANQNELDNTNKERTDPTDSVSYWSQFEFSLEGKKSIEIN